MQFSVCNRGRISQGGLVQQCSRLTNNVTGKGIISSGVFGEKRMSESIRFFGVISESMVIGKDIWNVDRSFWFHYAFEIRPDLGGVRLSAKFFPAIVLGPLNGFAKVTFGRISCTLVNKSMGVLPTAS